MKICAYEVREDEKKDFARMAEKLQVEIELHDEIPGPDTAALAEGCEGVTMLGMGKIDKELLDMWKSMGVQCISTRTIGYNHIDTDYAKEIGMQVCNAAYPPSGVAEFTLMLMLMCLRNYKQSLWRGQVNDFALQGLQGKEIGSMTVGVIGTGKIGAQVIKYLTGFGCRILAYDMYPNAALKDVVEYVELDELFAKADMITLHTPLLDSTYHLVNAETIAKMKDGVVLINCARGELMDTTALIEGIESGKIGALGLDVVEGERGIAHEDHRIDILSNQQMAYLRQFRNVTMTPHMAFYTDVAVSHMVECGVAGLVEMLQNGDYFTRIK
ncbi:MAG: D-isomer specific 2-hydroxyacid dehydrogenase family protein [Lachnospiraceae bacterium]